MKNKFLALLLVTLCSPPAFSQSGNFVRYVNPLIGTQKMGHTYPGATVPFGSVQLSPLSGNDDCGQMSAWYLFTALGFYPVTPGSGKYSLGSPVVKTGSIKFENGRTLQIEARNQGEKNVYVRNVMLNGRPSRDGI